MMFEAHTSFRRQAGCPASPTAKMAVLQLTIHKQAPATEDLASFFARRSWLYLRSLDAMNQKRINSMKNQKITITTILMAIGCFVFLSQIRAVSPAPDGCYPGFT